MKTNEFKRIIENLDPPYGIDDHYYLQHDSDNNIFVCLDSGYTVHEEYAAISGQVQDSFNFNPKKELGIHISDGLFKAVKEYATTPIDERKIDKRDKKITDLESRVDSLESRIFPQFITDYWFNYSNYYKPLSLKVLELKNDLDTIKHKKPRWFD